MDGREAGGRRSSVGRKKNFVRYGEENYVHKHTALDP